MASSTVFDLSNKALKLDTAEDLKPHIEPLTTSTTYTEILFNGNTIGVAAAQHFASVLRTQKNLQHVQFADIFTGRLLSEIPDALEALLTALLELPSLRTVNLSDNAFGLNLVGPLVKFLKAHVPLQHLILNNNGMGPIAGAQLADALTELASRKSEARKAGQTVPDLESIVCGRNRLENGSMEAWARAYKALGTVRSIRMTQNGIRPEGIVELLTNGLGYCKSLEVMDLQDNTFTITGGKALAKVLPSWQDLKELGLGDCYVTGRGFAAALKTLSTGTNTKLQLLKLTYNEIPASGIAALVGAVDKGGLPELRRVELNGNKFQEDDTHVEQLRDILNDRRKAAGAEDEDDEGWGMDELDDMEDDSDEEEEEEEDDEEDGVEPQEEVKAKADKELEQTNIAENAPVAQDKDADIDALADSLGKKLAV